MWRLLHWNTLNTALPQREIQASHGPYSEVRCEDDSSFILFHLWHTHTCSLQIDNYTMTLPAMSSLSNYFSCNKNFCISFQSHSGFKMLRGVQVVSSRSLELILVASRGHFHNNRGDHVSLKCFLLIGALKQLTLDLVLPHQQNNAQKNEGKLQQ